MRGVLLLIFLCPALAQASFEKGKAFGQHLLGQAGNLPATVNPAAIVPQYTDSPPQTGLTDETLADQAALEARSDPAASSVRTFERNRGKFLKLSENPVVTFAKDIASDPVALLARFFTDCREVPATEGAGEPEEETHTCEESGDPYEVSSTRTLKVETVIKEKIYDYTHIVGVQFRRSGRHLLRPKSPGRVCGEKDLLLLFWLPLFADNSGAGPHPDRFRLGRISSPPLSGVERGGTGARGFFETGFE